MPPAPRPIAALQFRLAGFYFLYFAVVGVLLPYWSLYLKEQGFSAEQIGVILATGMATKLIAPTLWGWLGDYTGRRICIVRLTCFAAALCFAWIPAVADSFWGVALVMFGYNFFWNATLPQFEATTLIHLGKNSQKYSHIRLWGSIGFIVTAMGFGAVLHHFDINNLPYILLVLFSIVWINSLTIPEPRNIITSVNRESIVKILNQPHVIALLLASVLMMASHGPYYGFFSIYLVQLDYSGGFIGSLWALGVIAEIGVFWLMPQLLSRYGVRNLLLITFTLTSLRWFLIGYAAQHIPVLLFAQLLHGFSYAMHHAVTVHMLYQIFGKNHQGQGQALYSSLSFGVGGIAGSLAAGYLWQNSNPAGAYAWAAGLGILGWIVIWRKLH
jgi:PPP family 3-phenylpropionic acid transporter